MAIKAGRVGVAREQVDVYGRLIPTQYLIDELRKLLDVEAAEISAARIAREELERLKLDEPIIQKPLEPIIPGDSFPRETEETEEEPEVEEETEEEEEPSEEEVEDGEEGE